jgi:predicted dehydrogenase
MVARKDGIVRYAAVGAGWITQQEFLPGVAHTGNSVIAALVTGDAAKSKALGARYGIARLCGYGDYDKLIRGGEVDAIYLALPNTMHRDFAIRALNAGVHVLCEKPMAPSEDDCRAMVDAAEHSGAKLMIAYRLHFDEATLAAIEIARSGRIGEPRFFASSLSQIVTERNHRTKRHFWAGPLPDMGPYPINMARKVFAAEPEEVVALDASARERRFAEVPEMAAVAMRFPGERLATFTVSFGAAAVDEYRIIGAEGDLRVSPGFGLKVAYRHYLTVDGKTEEREFPLRDQFGGETQYFSDCILRDRKPEPDGIEGLADVRVLAAIDMAQRTGTVQEIGPPVKRPQPTQDQVVRLAPVAAPELVGAAPPDAD